METINHINGDKNELHIPDILGGTIQDKVVFCLASWHPKDKHKSVIVQQCHAIEGSVNQALTNLVKHRVVMKTGRGRYKLVNLNQYKHDHAGANVLTEMLRQRFVTLPPEVLLSPLNDSFGPAAEQETPEPRCLRGQPVAPVLPCVHSQPETLEPKSQRNHSGSDDRLKEFVAEFLGTMRKKLDRFEKDVTAQDY